jgi:transcriptional regulator with XRE-family HTH domain
MTYDTKKALWENVKALMEKKYGKENIKRLAREAKIGTGTASRIKEQRTSVGLDVVEKIARLFKVPPASLLMPLHDKRLLAIAEAYSVSVEGRDYLLYTANAILEKHGRDQAGKADSE